MIVCLFVPSPCLPAIAASAQTTYISLTSASHNPLKWLQTPDDDWEVGAHHVYTMSWQCVMCDPGVCHDVMTPRPMECRSNSWTALCQCPQWPGRSLSSHPRTLSCSSLEFMAVTHCQQWRVFIAATSPGLGPRYYTSSSSQWPRVVTKIRLLYTVN